MELEVIKLNEVISKYKEIIKEYMELLDVIPRKYKNDPDLLEEFFVRYTNKLHVMEKSILKPYFARIDFQSDDKATTDICYIGKVGVYEDDVIITIDWRSPIASVYYDSNVGRTSYIAPMGVIDGELLIKRQFDIEKGTLKSFQDIDTVSNDEILSPYLGVSADSRLKNIVASIQSEQNEIIRESITKNIIIQGVAGSGKTTVALHRIAYLVYNNIAIIKPSQYMVIGPNKFFLNYISSVLPDLDVNNVSQVTLDELAINFIGGNLKINDTSLKLNVHNKIDKLKVSLQFKDAIDKYFVEIDKKVVPNKDFYLRDFHIMSYYEIKKIYDSIDKEKYDNINVRIKRAIQLISKNINTSLNYYMVKLSNASFSMKDSVEESVIKANLEYARREINSGCKDSLKRYFSVLLSKPLMLYNDFISNVQNYLDIDIECVKNNKIDFEDIAPLMYFKYKLSGSKMDDYRHVVIDEAQDFGEFNFYVLGKIMKNATFSIFGDLAQAIYGAHSISNWSEVVSAFSSNVELKHLVKSYRTTIEIMDVANNITAHLGMVSAVPLIRHGKEVEFIKYSSIDDIIKLINNFNQSDYGSMAIICKDVLETTYFYNELLKHNFYVHNIISTDVPYSGGICTITSYLAKGLEFDSVVITNSGQYNSLIETDMKLLYVAMTRSLHELTVLYHDTLPLPLMRYIN